MAARANEGFGFEEGNPRPAPHIQQNTNVKSIYDSIPAKYSSSRSEEHRVDMNIAGFTERNKKFQLSIIAILFVIALILAVFVVQTNSKFNTLANKLENLFSEVDYIQQEVGSIRQDVALIPKE